MKVGLICPYHMFRGGGVQECVLALQAELSRRGHYAKILTPLPRDYGGHIPDSMITVGASVNTKAFVGSAWQWSVSVDTDAIDEVFDREQFDVLHFHEPWIPVWSRQLLTRSTSANVATMHGRLPDTLTAKTITSVVTPYTKPMIKYFDAFTAVSEPATEYLESLSSGVEMTIIPNGVDIEKYTNGNSNTPHLIKEDLKTVLYIGRLEKRKGLKYLLDAYLELTNTMHDVQLVIAGSGPDEQKLKDYVHDYRIPRVHFIGFISEEEKLAWLHSADLFCSPARYGESFGIVLLEAMASAIPLIAGDNHGYKGVMKERGMLSLVNPADSLDFARRLQIMLSDQQLRQLWLQWAKDYVKQFDYGQIVGQYENVYKQAIAHHASKDA